METIAERYETFNKKGMTNGWRPDRVKWGLRASITFLKLVASVRTEFRNALAAGKLAGHMCGGRFRDNRRLVIRMQSGFTEAEFLLEPELIIYDALKDCASADHWYTYEKEWG